VADFEKMTLPPNVELDITARGGHCGFISDIRLSSVAEDYIAGKLATIAPAREPASRERAAAA
jgi:predicted alpha/beta-fold hydrolase